MEKGFALRIGAIFIIAVVSAIGVVLPSYIINSNKIKGQEKSENLTESLLFRATKTFSGGVILAVAFCHLLADSQEDLSDDEFTRYVNGYPMPLALALFGILLMVVIKELSSLFLQSIQREGPHAKLTPVDTIFGDVRSSSSGGKYDARMQLIKLAIFESTIGLHSIIIGFNLGTEEHIGTIEALIIALSFHQFFEGFSLGTMTTELETLPYWTHVLCFAFFSVTTPIGILIGICTYSTRAGTYAKGVVDGFAAGLLIHGSIAEIIGEEFGKETSNKTASTQKPVMCLTMMLGAAFMGVLAIWA